MVDCAGSQMLSVIGSIVVESRHPSNSCVDALKSRHHPRHQLYSWNEPASGCTFTKNTPTGEAGLRALHQVGSLLPPIALLKSIFWTAVPAVMALHAEPLSSAVFLNVNPTQFICSVQRFSAIATVKFAAPCNIVRRVVNGQKARGGKD